LLMCVFFGFSFSVKDCSSITAHSPVSGTRFSYHCHFAGKISGFFRSGTFPPPNTFSILQYKKCEIL
jgi:hypothetical protein